MTEPAPARTTPGQVLLGLFVLWQLFFMAATTFLDYVGYTRDLGGAAQALRDGLGRWERLTGQVQYWKLFSPDVGTASRFATVELHGDDGQEEQLRSIFEPADLAHYWRLPGWDDRFFNYEENLCTRLHIRWDDDKPDEQTARHHEARHAVVQRTWRPTLAYLRRRVAQFQEEHPDRPPPRAVVFALRVYPTPPPGTEPWQWPGPIRQPLVRWRPGTTPPEGTLPLEVYNPVTRQFEPVRAASDAVP